MGEQPPRFAARTRILRDASIENGAKVLYLNMDDIAMGAAFLRRPQATLAAIMGVTDRQIRRWVTLLADRGYLRRERTEASSLYVFAWSSTGRECPASGRECPPAPDVNVRLVGPIKSIGTQGVQETKQGPVLTCCQSCGQYHEGTQPARCGCGLIHTPSESVILDPVVEAQGWLLRAAGHAPALPRQVDAEIALRALEAAKGPVRLYVAIRTLVLSGQAAQARSYGWFVAVIGKQAAA